MHTITRGNAKIVVHSRVLSITHRYRYCTFAEERSNLGGRFPRTKEKEKNRIIPSALSLVSYPLFFFRFIFYLFDISLFAFDFYPCRGFSNGRRMEVF